MLSEQLQKDIQVESIKYESATQHEGLGPAIYIDGAEKYASKWQEEKELRERYEKALREIRTNAVFPKTENEAGVAIYNILKLCNDALTPKPTDNE